MKIIISFIATLVFGMVADFLWIGVVAKKFYTENLSQAFTLKFSLIPGLAFYLFYIIGIYYFVISPNIDSQSISKIIINSAIFGFMCYMTYDLTCLATIENFPIKVAIIDILWGTFAAVLIGSFFYYIYHIIS